VTSRATVKLVLAGVGILVWGYGARAELRVYEWTGVALVFAAFALRFLSRGRKQPPDGDPDASG
jgi:hypothetical protein